jgi:hypothetical protein
VQIMLCWLMVPQHVFFKGHRGLRQGCPLSPLLFLLVVEGFSRMLRRAQAEGHFSGIKITKGISITHLFFVDDVVILGKGSLGDWIKLKQLLSLFCLASGMEVNYQKSCFLYNCIEEELLKEIVVLFDIQSAHLDHGMKYLGFFLKPNDYRASDWLWLVQKIEKRIGNWVFHWLSLGGRLVLLKSFYKTLWFIG